MALLGTARGQGLERIVGIVLPFHSSGILFVRAIPLAALKELTYLGC